MSEDPSSDIPKGVLPVTQDMLKKRILEEPDQAWKMLRENPVAVVALSRVRRDLEESHIDDENYLAFKKKFDDMVNQVLGLETILDEYGIAFTTEVLNEIWRRKMQDPHLASSNKELLNGYAILFAEAELLPDGSNNQVIKRMVDFAFKRVLDFEEYEKKKSYMRWEAIKDDIGALIENTFNEDTGDNLPEKWLSWLHFASATSISAEIFRNNIAGMILQILKLRFDDFPEEFKFKIAPWMSSFSKTIAEFEGNEEKVVNEE